ncbi:MAG: hypothetical protein WB778_05970 [Thermoplasmata archaeon]
MSHIFQRPLCDLGRAYDYAYRSSLGEPNIDAAGGCDDRPVPIELYAAEGDPRVPSAPWAMFRVCSGHQGELRKYDREILARGFPSRLRTAPAMRS